MRRSRTRSPRSPRPGGSTNGVLHLLAIAAEAGIELSIDDFDTIAARTPIVADIKPGGRYVATDLFKAGGVALVARELVRGGLVNEAAVGVDGRSLTQVADGAFERPGQKVVVSWDDPLKPTGGLAILRGNLAPEGCVVKLAGHERTAPSRPGTRLRLGGGVLRRGQGADDRARRRRRDPLRGPRRRPGHARDAARHRLARRRGPGRRSRADHRRALLRRDARADGRPRRARGVPRRPDRPRPRRRHDRARRRRARRSTSTFRTTSSRAAPRSGQQPEPRYTRGVFAKYAASVGSASEGAITR